MKLSAHSTGLKMGETIQDFVGNSLESPNIVPGSKVLSVNKDTVTESKLDALNNIITTPNGTETSAPNTTLILPIVLVIVGIILAVMAYVFICRKKKKPLESDTYNDFSHVDQTVFLSPDSVRNGITAPDGLYADINEDQVTDRPTQTDTYAQIDDVPRNVDGTTSRALTIESTTDHQNQEQASTVHPSLNTYDGYLSPRGGNPRPVQLSSTVLGNKNSNPENHKQDYFILEQCFSGKSKSDNFPKYVNQ